MLDLFLGVKKTSKEMSSPTATVSVERDLKTLFTFHAMKETGVIFDCRDDTTPADCERQMEFLDFPTDWKRFGNKVLFWKTKTDDDSDDSDDDACSHGSDEHCDKV